MVLADLKLEDGLLVAAEVKEMQMEQVVVGTDLQFNLEDHLLVGDKVELQQRLEMRVPLQLVVEEVVDLIPLMEDQVVPVS
tara:strand:+ start:463 stop:705 length:243 start_codon:yes stop_codon:yes gene_type:complete